MSDIIRVARTWLGTPFHYGQCVKGAGVDCGRFPAAVYQEAGALAIDAANLPQLPPHWFMNRDNGSYLRIVQAYMLEYTGQKPQPTDLVLFKVARDWAHSALVVDWPRVICAMPACCVMELPLVLHHPQTGGRPMRFFRLPEPK